MKKINIIILVLLSLFILSACSNNQATDFDECQNEGPSVCGKINVQCITTPCDPVEETFSNLCEAEKRDAFDIKEGDCISNFEECIAAGNPAMESYPRQCRDLVSDRTFTEEIRQVCTEDEKKAEICTMDYDPVCGEIGLNTGETTYKTFANACGACSSMKVFAYTPGECQDKLFVVCDEGAKMFDPKEYAKNNNGICVEKCPEDFDVFMTQIGIQLCILHYGESEIEKWEKCEKSTDSCKCVKAYETTDEKQIENAEYRCVPEDYAERLLFRGGIDSIDENGEQSVMIA
jgi:hypothetical protein